MATYSVLNKLPAEAFKNPANFKTEYPIENDMEYNKKQFQTGLDYSNQSHSVTISGNSVWSCSLKNGGMVSSYEGIGYHACTAALLAGFLAGTAELRIERYDDDFHMTTTIIKKQGEIIKTVYSILF